MSFLVAREKDPGHSVVQVISDESTTISDPFESWCIHTGRQVKYVNRRMGRDLSAFYLGGSFEQQALFGMPFKELCAVVSDNMGPSDRERYQIAVQQQQAPRRHRGMAPWFWVLIGTIGAGVVAVAIVWYAMRFLLLMAILPFFIAWLSKRDPD